jgi:hypothetical protein
VQYSPFPSLLHPLVPIVVHPIQMSLPYLFIIF